MNLYLTTSALQKEKVEAHVKKNDVVDVLPPLAFDKISVENISVKKHIAKKDFAKLKMYKRSAANNGVENVYFVIVNDLDIFSKLYYYYKTFELDNEICVIRIEDMRDGEIKRALNKPIGIKNVKSSATDFLEFSSFALRHFLLHSLSKRLNKPYFFGLPQLLLLSSASNLYEKQLSPATESDQIQASLAFDDANVTSFVKEYVSFSAGDNVQLKAGETLTVNNFSESEITLEPPAIFNLNTLIQKLCQLENKTIRVASLLRQLSFLFNKGYISNYLASGQKITRSYAEFFKEKYVAEQFEFSNAVAPLADLEFESTITGIVPLQFTPDKINKLDAFSRLIYDLILERTASALCKPAVLKQKTAVLESKRGPVAKLNLKKIKTANWLNCEKEVADSPNYAMLHSESRLTVEELSKNDKGFMFITPYRLISEVCDKVQSPYLLLETLKCLNNKFFVKYEDGFMVFTNNFYTLYNSLNSNSFLANFAKDYSVLFEKVSSDYTQYTTSSNLIKNIFNLQSKHLVVSEEIVHPCSACADGKLKVTYNEGTVVWACDNKGCKAVLDNAMAKPRYEEKKCPKCSSFLVRQVVDDRNAWVCNSGFFECDYIESSISK